MKKIVSSLVLIGCIVVNLTGCRKANLSKESAKSDTTNQATAKVAGNWILPVLLNAKNNGLTDKIELSELLKDPKIKFVLIHYWATWGEPANIYLAYLNDIFTEYKDKGLMVLGISIDNNLELRDNVIKTIEEMKRQEDGKPANITYPILWDVMNISKDSYGIGAIPVTLLVDKNNIIVYQQSGFSKELIQELKGKLNELIQ